MSLFDVNADEIKEAITGGREKVELKDGEEPTFIIEEVKEKENDKGEYLIVALKFVGGEHNGKEHAIFIGDKPAQKKTLLRLLNALLPQEELLKVTSLREVLPRIIARQFKTKVKLNEWEGRTYTNYLFFEEVGGAPDLKIAANDNSDIPF